MVALTLIKFVIGFVLLTISIVSAAIGWIGNKSKYKKIAIYAFGATFLVIVILTIIEFLIHY